MYTDFLIFFISLVLLLISADFLVDSVVSFARRLNVSTMVIGLTVVSVGTSLPEVMASGTAALRGHPEIALGNVVGSNICNVGLILGLPALFAAVTCHRSFIAREGMLMLLLSFGLLGFGLLLGEIPRWGGGLFLLGFCCFIWQVFRRGKKEAGGNDLSKGEEEGHGKVSHESLSDVREEADRLSLIILKVSVSLLVLLLSSNFLVDSTVSLAQDLGVSEAVIALSMIAFGTSVPELSVSLAAAKKRQGDILVGNILGSNISNILLVLGLASLSAPISISGIMLWLDIPVVLSFAALMIFFLWQPQGVSKPRGILLLLMYALVLVRCVVFPA